MADGDELGGFELQLPHELGRYRLEAEIGRGGMGAVYYAVDTLLERPVAVKVLLPQLAADTQFVQRFKREAQMAARLEHPNIVTVHDVGQVEGLVYFVMRFVSGKPLDRLIEEGISWTRAEHFALQVADAMAYAHENQVIHRDIKPDNVIISKDGVVTITDFGLARPEAQKAGGPTQAGLILGTPGYMAPEQALGTDVDARADIYAFGVMLFELITGQLPFDGETAFSIINQHINTPAPDLKTLQPNCPPWLADLVARLLAKKPADRPQRMAEVAQMLRTQQGSAVAPVEAGSSSDDTTAQGLIGRIRRGELSLAEALQKNPEVAQTLQEVFRKELTVVSFDLAGSTALKQQGGGTVAIGPLFNAYRQLVDQALGDHKCLESVWAGDGTVAMFDSPSEAVASAQDIVRGLATVNQQFAETPDLGVRVGIHTGGVLRDPNQQLGQVTSTTLDVTGHIQKDARAGLVEISQATLDKLPSQEGWIRIRTAREGNLGVFAWHPEGPDKVPQSWIQRMMYGRLDSAEEKVESSGGGVPKEVKTTTASTRRAAAGGGAARVTSRTVRPAAKTEPEKVFCPYCEGEVTVKDQKCPHCDRLNRHYDPAVAEAGGWFKKPAAQPLKRAANTREKRTTLVEQRMADAKKRTTGAMQRPGQPGARRPGQPAPTKIEPTVYLELVLGVVLGAVAWIGIAYGLQKAGYWWWQTASATKTNPVVFVLSGGGLAAAAAAIRNEKPGIGVGMIGGLVVAFVFFAMRGWFSF
ncbi:MAG: protein kinase [Fimbriimonadaceae bacterium]|nr:protein kinase [Fimbriimonadaceae bacterium]